MKTKKELEKLLKELEEEFKKPINIRACNEYGQYADFANPERREGLSEKIEFLKWVLE